jgi:CubicO group peptidase (beta-lactamase class C family)
MLAQMVAQHKVALDQPVRELLPPGTVAKPEGAEINLLDLAMQHSGLPRLPDNLQSASLQDPYAAYHPANLYQYLSKHGVAKPADPQFNYSNLGLGLLGQALANRSGTTYPELLQELVTAPLKLADTVVKLSPGQEKRFAQGHNPQHQPVGPWNFDALAGAGAIRSTAADLLTYLEAQLHPDRAPATLAGALAMCHELHGDVGPKMKIGLAWIFETDTGSYWHNGGTGGYSSYALFNPKEDYAVVVLFNATITATGSFADSLGQHIAQRLTGKPAVLLHD